MHIFQIRAATHTVSVFANGYDHAVQLFMLHWKMNYDDDLPDLEVNRRNPTWPGLDIKLLAEALNRNIAGVGRLDQSGGWVIVPADHLVVEAA